MTTPIAFSFMGLGLPEILIIAVVGLLIFGSTRLPDLGRSFGKTITSFREGMSDNESSPTSNQPQTTKVEPEPLKPPQRLTAPTFGTENAQQPPKA
jgi:sec-independent protein translocase protein TatA